VWSKCAPPFWGSAILRCRRRPGTRRHLASLERGRREGSP
jgi:hypothetical protein